MQGRGGVTVGYYMQDLLLTLSQTPSNALHGAAAETQNDISLKSYQPRRINPVNGRHTSPYLLLTIRR